MILIMISVEIVNLPVLNAKIIKLAKYVLVDEYYKVNASALLIN